MTEKNEENKEVTFDKGTMELFAALIQQNAKDLNFTTDALLFGYKNSAEMAQATVDAIRYGINRLLSSDYMPTTAAIKRALYPSEELVEAFMPQNEAS